MTRDHASETTQVVDEWIKRLNSGNKEARGELLRICSQRMLNLTRKMKRGYSAVNRWERTDDVYQQAAIRLCRALDSVQLKDTKHLFRLMATQIRRELIDMSRHYRGPEGMAAHHMSVCGLVNKDEDRAAMVFDPAELTGDPSALQEWADFHALIEELPDEQREVVDLLWYHQMSQEEAAAVLQISTRHVRRLWRNVKLMIYENLADSFPGV